MASALASTSRNWPRHRPWPQSSSLGLGLGLRALTSASVSASRFWPRLTSLRLTLQHAGRTDNVSKAAVVSFHQILQTRKCLQVEKQSKTATRRRRPSIIQRGQPTSGNAAAAAAALVGRRWLAWW